MTAPRAREANDPPSPPDRRPPRRGGGSSLYTYAASAAGRAAGPARLSGARRGLVRSARALAATALLILSGALALPATAQDEVLVSNIDKVQDTTSQLYGKQIAQGFTTGRSNSNYSLTSIEVGLLGTTTGVTVTATVMTSSGGAPGEVHATLSLSGTLAAGNNTFAAAANTTLAANTPYFLVLESDATSGLWVSAIASGDQAGALEWEIADQHRRFISEISGWSTASGVFQIRVNGTINGRPTPTAFNVRGSGNKLWLFVNENLSNILPPTSAFTLTAAGSPVTIGSISLQTNLRTLNLTDFSPLIGAGQTVTLDYTDPSTGDDTNAIQDINGLDAASFSNVVVNDSAVTLPKPTAAAVPADGATVALTFSETLFIFQPAYSSAIRNAFTVTVDGTERQTTDFAVSGATATLTMSDTIEVGQTVIVSYDRSAAGREALGTGSKRLVANFTTGENSVPAVTNNSTAGPARLASAAVDAAGTRLTLTFNKSLNAESSARDWFTVTADGADVRINAFQGLSTASDSFTILFFSGSPIYKDEAVVVVYEKPAGSDGFTDEANDVPVASFTTGQDGVPAVANAATTVAPPGPDTAASTSKVGTGGSGLVLAFDGPLATDNAPPASAFSITAGGVAIGIGTVLLSSTMTEGAVSLAGLTPKVRQGETVELTYTDPTSADDTNALQGTTGTDVHSFTVTVTNASTVTTGPPRPPTGLTATALGATIVDLAWTAPADDGDSAITGYKVEVSNTGSSNWTDLAADTGNANAWYRHTGLSDGYTRYYRVSAINANGTSPASASANATTMIGAHHTAPATIYGDVLLSATMTVGTARGGVSVGYNTPAVGGVLYGAASPTTFDLDGITAEWEAFFYGTSSRRLWFYIDTNFGDGLFNVHAGGTAFEFDSPGSVSSLFKSNVSNPNWQHGDTVEIRLVEATAPAKPTEFSATAAGNAQIDLAWTAPADDGGRAVSGYKIEVSDDGSTGSWTDLVADTASTDTAYSHTGLSAGDTRHYRVSAINAVGTSDASASDNATTQRTVPDPPEASAIADGTSKIVVSWSAPENDGGSAITGYMIEVSPDGVSDWRTLVEDTTDTSYTHTGLSAGTTRHYRVYATNAQGTSQPSAVVSDMTQPGATSCTPNPGDYWCGVVTVALHTEGGFDLAYGFVDTSVTTNTSDTGALSDETFPVGPNNYTIDVVTVGLDAVGGNLAFSLTSDLTAADKEKLVLHVGSRSFAFSDVTANTDFTYLWHLSGLDWSSSASITLRLRRVPAAPGAPTNLMAEADGDTRIELTWTAPADDGGSAITGYRIEVSDDGSSGSWTELVADTGNADTSYTHDGLSPGDTRHYRVSAINATGRSEASDSDDATTEDPPTLSSATVDALNGKFTAVNVHFSEDLDIPLVLPTAVVDSLTITVDDEERQILDITRTSATRLIANLSSEVYQGQTVVVSYDKSVAGSDAIADSDGDEVASFTTGEDGVPAVVNNSTVVSPVSTPTPENFAAAPGNARVVLSWDPPAADSGVTRHEYRFKEEGTGSYPPDWTAIPDSGVDEANQAGFTVRADLTNETAYTFQLHAVNADGESPAAEAGPVTPTPGICDRTQQVRDEILNALSDVDDCAAVTVADLATVTELYIVRQNVTALRSGDFAGLSAVGEIQLRRNALSTLPPDLFSGLSALRVLILSDNALTSLPPGVFSGLSALEDLSLSGNAGLGPHLTGSAFSALGGLRLITLNGIGLDTVPAGLFSRLSELTSISLEGNGIGALPASLFSGLAGLEVLSLGANRLATLPDGVFSGLSALTEIVLTNNRLTELSAGVFSGLTKLKTIRLASNRLRTLPDGVFAGLTDLEHLILIDNSNLLRLTVTLETVAGGQVRAKVLAGAPSDLALRVSVENGVLARGAEALQVATGSVAGAPVQVIRTADSGEVTVDLVMPLPSPAPGHSGYEFVRAASGLPAEVADALEREPGVEGEFRLAPETVADYADPDNDRHGGKVGPVEVYHAGAWGTVCSDGIRDSKKDKTFSTFDYDATGDVILDADGNPQQFDKVNEAAALICKDRGYDDGEYHMKYGKFLPGQAEAEHQDADYWPPHSSYPPGGPTPIWLDDLRCVAGESALGTDPLPGAMSHCSYAGWGLHNCTHKEDAVVRCWNDDSGGAGLKSLKGRFVSPPERHDGTNRVKVRVAFSEPVEESPENVGAHGVEVEGGEVTSVSAVGGDAPDGAGTRSDGGRNAGQQDREVVWEFEIEPDSDGDLTVTLEAGRPCGEPGAICTADGRALSEGISTTVEGPEAGPPPLTASFVGLPEAHDGESAFRFRVAFSENIGISYRSLREDAFAVSGGRVTRGRRVDDRRDLFEMTVEPDGDGEVTVTLPAGRECGVSGAICTKGENRRQLTNAPTATVAGPAVETGPAGLTARFVDMPSEHDGETAFKFRIAFSEEIRMSGRRLRSEVVAVSGGRATKAGRANRRKDLWKLKVRPDSLADVTVTLSSGAACDTPGAVCTADGRALSNTISATVRGPVAVSVADARAREGEDETIDFAVSLSRAASRRVSVSYATADGTARAGSDYTRASGKLRFAPGETEKTISVPVLDDAHDEGAETFTLRLSAASGAAIADGVATGTIENTDHMPAAWLARFGRTVTDQVLDAVGERLAAPRAAGAQATLAGQALPSWDGSGKAAADPGTGSGAGGDATAANDNPGAGSGAGDNAASERALAARDRDAMTAIRDWMARSGAGGPGASDPWGEGPEDRVQSRALTGRDFLTGTSFALTGGSAEAGGYAALWGRGAISRFDGREGDLSLDGEVTTGLMGADWASGPGSRRWTAGLAVGHARGTGSYREGGGCTGGGDTGDGSDGDAGDRGASRCAGEVEATLTGLWPYGGLQLTDRLSAWGAAGYGAGEMRLTPGGGSPFTADLTMAMGAAGLRGEVLAPPEEGGLALAVKGDTRFTRTASKATKDADGGRLAAATADVWLLRAGIEGSRRFVLAGSGSGTGPGSGSGTGGGDAGGMVLTPSFELGARLDGGDAETGLGVDLGGGLAFAAPRQGVALDLKGRGLIAHEASGFREWGASAALTWDPRPTTDRGLALRLRQSWGGSPTGGMDALLGRETLAGLAANDDGGTASAGRFEAELGFGLPLFGGGFTGTPNLGIGFSETARDYRVGWRLTSARKGDPGFAIGLDATRREPANADAEHGLMLRGTVRW